MVPISTGDKMIYEYNLIYYTIVSIHIYVKLGINDKI